jgi:hypothetical protein
MGRAALAAVAGFTAVYHGRAEEVSRARREVRLYVRGCPRADDATLIISELSTNAVLHSRSRGGFFTVRCELYPDYVWLETQDAGGPFRPRRQDGDAFHGLHIIGALAGEGNHGFEVTGDAHRKDAGKDEFLTGDTPDGLNRAIRADFARRGSPPPPGRVEGTRSLSVRGGPGLAEGPGDGRP